MYNQDFSGWGRVNGVISQGLVLGYILFHIVLSDLEKGVNS